MSKLQTVADVLKKPWISIPATLLAGLIAVALFGYITNDRLAEFTDRMLPRSVVEFIGANEFWIFSACIIVFTCSQVWQLIERHLLVSGTQNLTIDGALALMGALNSIVEQKADRFGNELKSIKKNGKIDDKSEVFSTITKPDQQIFCIVNTVHSFLEQLAPDLNFQVRLVEVKEGKPTRWYTCAPQDQPPEHDISEFENGQSTIATCISKKKLIIIPDVVKESKKKTGRRYLMLDDEDKGSIICLPVYHSPTKTTPYILSIKANKPNYFSQAKSEYYQWLLDHFVLRIRLEHSLRELKSERGEDGDN